MENLSVHDPGTVRSPRPQQRMTTVIIDACVAFGIMVSQINTDKMCRQTTGRGVGVDLRPCGQARHPKNDHYCVYFGGAVRSRSDLSI